MAIMCMALIGIAIMLAEIHRYMVYEAEMNKLVKKEGGTVYRSRGKESGR